MFLLKREAAEQQLGPGQPGKGWEKGKGTQVGAVGATPVLLLGILTVQVHLQGLKDHRGLHLDLTLTTSLSSKHTLPPTPFYPLHSMLLNPWLFLKYLWVFILP